MKQIQQITKTSKNRIEFWSSFINTKDLKTITEIGVYKGDFAEQILLKCSNISKYYMIDPWRNLVDWNKPANVKNEEFEEYFEQTKRKTHFAASKREILRGVTTDVIDEIKNQTLDFVYIDGDHTLKGISIDLISTWDKVKNNGFIAGDDFCASIWQHDKRFEPTLVFPFAVYFAEAKNVKIYALPFNQFLIDKEAKGFEFIDFTNGKYDDLSILNQLKLKTTQRKSAFISKFFNYFE